MDGETPHRSLLPISSVSLIGTCETRFIEAMEGRQVVTKQMKIGKAMHKKMEEGLTKVSPEQIVQYIKEGKAFWVREFTLTDKKMKLIGRIDQLNMLGTMVNGRNQGIIIDDKFPKHVYREIPLYQKLQLSMYAVAVGNSEILGPICDIIGIRLICRETETRKILNTFDINGKAFETCKENVGIATKQAWKLYNKEITPKHIRFDVGNGEWVKCYCEYSDKQRKI